MRVKPKPLCFIEMAVGYEGSDCLLWPFSKGGHGYAQINFHGKMMTAHTLVCTLAHGPKPPDKNECAHSCGNRACVNPHHLRWATWRENNLDKIAHGTHAYGEIHPRAKLTEKDIKTILSLKGIVKQAELAARFGVSEKHIGCIVNRRTWRHLHV